MTTHNRIVCQFSNGFIVDNRKQAAICIKQGCRVHGERVITVYPTLDRWINLPFKVTIGDGLSAAVTGMEARQTGRDPIQTNKLRLVKVCCVLPPTKRNPSIAHRTPAVWEVGI